MPISSGAADAAVRQVCPLCLLCAQALAAEQAAAEAEARRQADETARRLQIQAEKAALVAAEAPAEQPHLTLLFRLPDGSRLSRRFRTEQRLKELYDFVDSKVRRRLLTAPTLLGTGLTRRLQTTTKGEWVTHCVLQGNMPSGLAEPTIMHVQGLRGTTLMCQWT